jgi:hypothetical protein
MANQKSDDQKMEEAIRPFRKESALLHLISLGASALNANLINHDICPIRDLLIRDFLTSSSCQPFDLNVIIFSVLGFVQLVIAAKHIPLRQLFVPFLIFPLTIWILVYVEVALISDSGASSPHSRQQEFWMPYSALIFSQICAWTVLICSIGYFGMRREGAVDSR